MGEGYTTTTREEKETDQASERCIKGRRTHEMLSIFPWRGRLSRTGCDAGRAQLWSGDPTPLSSLSQPPSTSVPWTRLRGNEGAAGGQPGA